MSEVKEVKNEIVEKNISDSVLAKVKNFENKGQLILPEDYSAENALKSAYLMLQETTDMNKKPVLSSCTKESIANTLLDMVVQGLNPAKKQCYFIAYGNKLTLSRSYFGTIAVAKSFGEIEDVQAQVILKGDDFKFEIKQGRKIVTKHEQTFESMSKAEIIGAYATIVYKDGKEESAIMTIEDIKKSWNQSKTNAAASTSVHSKFPEEMCKRTVINRLLKPYINSKKDTNLVLKNAIDRSEEDRAEAEINEEIKVNSNKEEMDIVIDAEYRDVQETESGIKYDVETGEVIEESKEVKQEINADF